MNGFYEKPTDEFNIAAKKALKEGANWSFVFGIGLVLLGSLALVFSVATTLFSVIYLGVLLTIAGAFEAFKSFKIRTWGSFFLHLLLGILYIIGGIYILAYPTLSAMTLTLLLAYLLIAIGIVRIIASLFSSIPYRGWALFNGVLTTILGFLIWYEWPVSGLWAIGAFVGIDLLFTGIAWIVISAAIKRIAR